ncbi:MAG: heterocyst development glycosyltransferase HepC [Cyanobacteria bacterium P01_G01_bin.19]
MVNHVQITKIKTFGLDSDSNTESFSKPQYQLQWRNKMLIVNINSDFNMINATALKSDWWLTRCLQKSPIKLIRVPSEASEAEIRTWTIAAEKTDKKVFLHSASDLNLSRLQKTRAWKLKRLIDFVMAVLALLILSPVAFAIAIKQKLAGKTILEKQLCVGKRGLVYRTFTWADIHSNSFGNRQILRLGLHKLPQLINVLRGEMTLVGYYPFSLDEALTLNTNQRKILNTVPGVLSITPWRSPSSDLRAISNKSYNYFCNWSLYSDLKIIWLAVLRLFQGKSYSHQTAKL